MECQILLIFVFYYFYYYDDDNNNNNEYTIVIMPRKQGVVDIKQESAKNVEWHDEVQPERCCALKLLVNINFVILVSMTICCQLLSQES